MAALDPSLQGTLATVPLARLLSRSLGAAPSGTLELRSPNGVTSHVVLAAGQLAKIRVPQPALYLSSIAYEYGFLTTEGLNASLLEIARSKKLHGALMLEQRRLTTVELARCLSEQMERKLFGLFALPDETAFAFYPALDALTSWGGQDWPRRDLSPCVLRALREHPPVKHIQATMLQAKGHSFRLPASVILRGLSVEEGMMADCLRARALEPAELAAATALDRSRSDLFLFFLIVTGSVERDAVRPSPFAFAQRLASSVRPPSLAAPRVTVTPSPFGPMPSSVRSTNSEPPMPASRPPPTTSGTMNRVSPHTAPADRRAATKFAMEAHAALKLGKREVAERLCDEASAADPDELEHRALRVWLMALTTEGMTRRGTVQAVGILDRIIEVRDESAHARFFRGQLYKRLGIIPQAARDFRAALDLDPKRHDAMAELRLCVARHKQGR